MAWQDGDRVRISITFDGASKTAGVEFSGLEDGSGNPWSFVEHFEPSKLPSALYGFAAGLRALMTGEWS